MTTYTFPVENHGPGTILIGIQLPDGKTASKVTLRGNAVPVSVYQDAAGMVRLFKVIDTGCKDKSAVYEHWLEAGGLCLDHLYATSYTIDVEVDAKNDGPEWKELSVIYNYIGKQCPDYNTQLMDNINGYMIPYYSGKLTVDNRLNYFTVSDGFGMPRYAL